MQVKRKLRKLIQKPDEIRVGLRLRARATRTRVEMGYDHLIFLLGIFVAAHQKKVRRQAERVVETWDFGFWHGLFTAEDGYMPGQDRPEALLPNRFADEMADVSHMSKPDYLTTGRLPTGPKSLATAQLLPSTHEGLGEPIAVSQSPEERARQAEIDGLPGKAARLRGATEEQAQAVELPIERQARENKEWISREFARGQKVVLNP